MPHQIFNVGCEPLETTAVFAATLTSVAVFAGELDYSRYGPVDKYMMRLVMWINNGPTDFATKVEFTNWDDVERFAGEVAKLTAGADVAVVALSSSTIAVACESRSA